MYKFTPAQQALWHSLAVGLYYRNASADLVDSADFARVVPWEHLSLATKLEWQAKAKAQLLAVLVIA